MAVRVAKDMAWYTAAVQQPASVFRRAETFIQRSYRRRQADRITETTRKDMRVRMSKALAAAQDSLLKWSAKVWTRPRHLLGAVCDEKYRLGVAQLVLILMGHGKELGDALAQQSGGGTTSNQQPAAGSRRRSRIDLDQEQEGGTRAGGRGVVEPAAPVDDVQRNLYALLRQRHEEGALAKEWQLWGLGAHLQEWLVLAKLQGTARLTCSALNSPLGCTIFTSTCFSWVSATTHAWSLTCRFIRRLLTSI